MIQKNRIMTKKGIIIFDRKTHLIKQDIDIINVK